MGQWTVPDTLSESTLSELRETVISICDRYVYSKTCSNSLQETVAHHAGDFRYGVNALMPTGVKFPDATSYGNTSDSRSVKIPPGRMNCGASGAIRIGNSCDVCVLPTSRASGLPTGQCLGMGCERFLSCQPLVLTSAPTLPVRQPLTDQYE